METAQYLNKWVVQPVAYNTRDLLIYALGIGCCSGDPNFVYENHDQFAAFPTYPTVLMFKGASQDVVSFPSPTMINGPAVPALEGVRVMLDGEKQITKLAPLPPGGASLEMRSRLTGVHKRGSGAVVETEYEFVDSGTGTLLYRIISAAFMVGATNFQSSGVSRSAQVTVPRRPPDCVEEMLVPSNQHLLYRLSGDYNALHVDPEFAKASGFESPIMHGLCSLGFSTRAVLKRFAANDPARFSSICVRFSSPVMPGHTIRVEMWDEGSGRIVFRSLVKETGKICISNSCMQLTPSAHSKL